MLSVKVIKVLDIYILKTQPYLLDRACVDFIYCVAHGIEPQFRNTHKYRKIPDYPKGTTCNLSVENFSWL